MEIIMPIFTRNDIVFYTMSQTTTKLFQKYREKGLVEYNYTDHSHSSGYFVSCDPYVRIEEFYNSIMKDIGSPLYKKFKDYTFKKFVIHLDRSVLPEQSGIKIRTHVYTLKLEQDFDKISILVGTTFTGTPEFQRLVWDREMLDYVNEMYDRDFVKFGYIKY